MVAGSRSYFSVKAVTFFGWYRKSRNFPDSWRCPVLKAMTQSATPIADCALPSDVGSGTMPYFTPLESACFSRVGCPLSMPTSPLVKASKAACRSSLPGSTGPVSPCPTILSRRNSSVLTLSAESMEYASSLSV